MTSDSSRSARRAALWRRHKLKIIFSAIGLTAAILAMTWLIRRFSPTIFTHQPEIHHFIQSFGVFSPLVFVIFQAVQIVIAPIPGNVTTIAGGWLFGHWGLLWTLIGATLGFWVVILISRRFGRPLIEKIFKAEQVKKFDFIAEKDGALALFLIFLLPGFPDDLLSYLAGLTKIKTRNLLLISLAGRLPGYLLLNLIGAGVAEGAVRQIVALLSIFLLIAGICIFARKWLMAFFESQQKAAFLKKSWQNFRAKFARRRPK